MNLSYLTLQRLSDELHTAFSGKPVKAASMQNAHDLVLHFGQQSGLLLSASPNLGRIASCLHTTEGEPELPGWVQKHVVHSFVESITQVPYERIIVLSLLSRDRVGGKSRCRLIVEVMGRNSNIILVSEPENRIIGTFESLVNG